MASSIRRFGLFALALVALSCVKETPAPQTYSGRKLCVSIDDPATKAFINPDGAVKTVTWTTEDVFHVYRLENAECRDVRPVSVNESGSKVILPMPFEEENVDLVVTFGGATYAGDSLVLAEAPIKQGLFTSGYDANSLPLSTGIVSVRADSKETHMTLRPLTALVEMDLENLPNPSEKIRSINVSTTMAKGTKGYSIAASSYCYYLQKDGSMERGTTLYDLYEGGDYGCEIELTAGELIAHNGSLPVYFLAAHFSQGDEVNTYITQLDVTIVTDKSTIKKSFDTSAAKLRTTCGRASRFTLNFSGAKVTPRKGFSVIWSEGYLQYDAASQGYCFAQPGDHGLYFKPGSVMGMDMFTSVDPDERFASSRYLFAYRWNTNTDTLDETYYNNIPWEVGAADLRTYKVDASGNVVPVTISSYDDVDDFVKPADISYKAAADPCSYVKDGYKWRMASNADYQELIDCCAESISNWKLTTRGESVYVKDDRPRVLTFTDVNGQSVGFSTTGVVAHSKSLTKSGTYAGYLTNYVYISSTFSVYVQTPDREVKNSTTYGDYVYVNEFNIGSLNNLRAESEQDPKLSRMLSVYSDHQGATVIRCVRNK